MSNNGDERSKVLNRFLPEIIEFLGKASAYAPSNIALSKYWGKRASDLNLPCNSSLSISLAEWGTQTSIEPSPSGQDEVNFNGSELDPAHPDARKVTAHADLFRYKHNIPLRIVTSNTIPTAAGLASSASGFAALTLALDRAFGLDLPKQVLSIIARMGSGSAARSLWHGFVRWERGQAEDGTDSVAHPLDVTWPEFRVAIVAVDTGPKKHSSRDGMNHTLSTSPLFSAWPQQAEEDCMTIEKAVLEKDLKTLGTVAEANALAMHATMIAARPSLSYLSPQSWQVLERLSKARKDGLSAYATMDAGANVKLIFEDRDSDDIVSLFPDATIIAPFDAPPPI